MVQECPQRFSTVLTDPIAGGLLSSDLSLQPESQIQARFCLCHRFSNTVRVTVTDWQEMHFLFLCSLRCVSIYSSTDSFHLLHISLQNQKAICFFFVENRKWNARDLVSRSRILSFWAALTFVFLIFSQLHLFLDSGNYYLLEKKKKGWSF